MNVRPVQTLSGQMRCRKEQGHQNRVVRVLQALGEAVAKRLAGLFLWLIQPALVLFLRSAHASSLHTTKCLDVLPQAHHPGISTPSGGTSNSTATVYKQTALCQCDACSEVTAYVHKICAWS